MRVPEPRWKAEVSRPGGYFGMTDADCEQWALEAGRAIALDVEDSAISQAVLSGYRLIAVERVQVSVWMPRVRRFWCFDRARPFRIEGHSPIHVYLSITEGQCDHAPIPPMTYVRRVASA